MRDTIKELTRPLINEELQEVVKSYAKGANKDTAKMLQQILEVVDGIREEVDQQGKDLLQNTVEVQNLRTEFNAFRNTVNKRDKGHQDNVEDIVKSVAKEVIQNEVPDAVQSVVEPRRKSLRGLHPSWWKRIKIMSRLGKGVRKWI